MIKVTEHVYAEMHHPGGNVGCIVTELGTVLIDTPMFPEEAQKLTEALRRLSGRDIAYIVYTHQHFDHIMGSGYFGKPAIAHQAALSGIMFLKTNLNKEIQLIYPDLDEKRKAAFAHLEIVQPQITFSENLTLHMGDVELQLSFAGGHSSASIVIYSPKDKVLFAGDNIATGRLPITDNCRFGSWIELLRRIEDMDIEAIIPGHGDICGKEAVYPVRVYFETMRDRVKDLMNSRASKEQVLEKIDLADCIPMPPSDEVTQRVAFDIARMYDQLAKGIL
jgi:cyclase